MKSAQLNFFMMPEDIAEMDNYLQKNDLLIVNYSNLKPTALISSSLQNINEIKAFLVLNENIDKLKFRYIEINNNFIIDEFQSPQIEYFKTIYNVTTNVIRAGRVYFNKTIYDENTIKTANDLFKWLKKYFKNNKIEQFYATIKTQKYIYDKNIVRSNL